jgi:hypothetical protein
MVESRYEGVDVKSFSPLFYAYKAENISIIGRGLINGHGKSGGTLWKVIKKSSHEVSGNTFLIVQIRTFFYLMSRLR